MRLTNRSEYALLALAYLARLPEGEFAHADEIADSQEIPKRFLQQILHTLGKARFVRSLKGPQGGYCLDRAADKISLADVVRLFEGPLAPTRSASKLFYATTPIERERKILAVFQKMRSFASELLEGTTLRDVAR